MRGAHLREGDAVAFWSWFQARRHDIEHDVASIRQMGGPSNLITDELGERLRTNWPDLVHEIGRAGDGVFELIISADGIRGRFPVVTECVKNAPELPGWRFIAFRPRQQELPASVVIEGTEVPADDFVFVPHERSELIDLDVLYRGPLPAGDHRIAGASYLLLDFALGEFDVETRIGRIDRRAMRKGESAAGAVDLGKLVSVVDEIVRRRSRDH
jgi:hypothetical protein